MKRQIWRWTKVAGGACLALAGVMAAAAALLYAPPVQRLAVSQAARLLAKTSGLELQADEIRLSFPLKLRMREVLVTGGAHDTVLYLGDGLLHLRPWPLLAGRFSIDTLSLARIRLETGDRLAGLEIAGRAALLTTASDEVHPAGAALRLSTAQLSDAAVRIHLHPQGDDDESEASNWMVRVDCLRLQRVEAALYVDADSLRMACRFEDMQLDEGAVDLAVERFSASRFRLSDAALSYDDDRRPAAPGLDVSHSALADVHVALDSVFFQGKNIRAQLHEFTAHERSGLEVQMSGAVYADTTCVTLAGCSLRTPYSTVQADVTFPRAGFGATGEYRSEIEAALARRDVLTALGIHAQEIARYYPDTLLRLSARLEGTAAAVHLHRLHGELPGVFRVEAHGEAALPADRQWKRGALHVAASTGDSPLPDLLPEAFPDGRVRIPPDAHLQADATLRDGDCSLSLSLREGQGTVRLEGHYHTLYKEYALRLEAEGIEPVHFLPRDSVLRLDATLAVEGRGDDVFLPSAWTQFSGRVTGLHTPHTSLSELSVDGSLREHQLHVSLAASGMHLRGTATLDGELRHEHLGGRLAMSVDSLDLCGLRLAEMPFAHSFHLFAEMETDREQHHRLDIALGNWEMTLGAQRFSPDMITLHAVADRDTSCISLNAGDLGLLLTSRTDAETAVRRFGSTATAFMQQLARRDSLPQLPALQGLLPDVALEITAGRDNPVYDCLRERSIFFDSFTLRADASPDAGLQLHAELLSLLKDTARIDTLRLSVRQDSTGVWHGGEIVKNKFRRQQPFTAGWHGSLTDRRAALEVFYRNGRGETGLLLGAGAERRPEGYLIRFDPGAVIGFLPFQVNEDNFILTGKGMRDLSAALRLDGENNASVWLYSRENEGGEQELNLEISRINLDMISRGLGLDAPLQGMADISLRCTPADSTYIIAADAGIDRLMYRNGHIGELRLSGAYLPAGDDVHRIDVHVSHDGQEISAFTAGCESAGARRINGTLDIRRLPLKMLAPFFEGAVQPGGALLGHASVAGTADAPLLNGYVQFDTATVGIAAAATQLRLDTQRIEIRDSRIHFNRYGVTAAGNSPVEISGAIDMQNPARAVADLTLTAHRMQLMNAPKTPESLVYGRVSVDLQSTLKGALNALEMRGSLHLLGNTNLAYILKDSPLEAKDRMAGLVSFVYFEDTVPRRVRRPYMSGATREYVPVDGLDVLLTLRIDPAVKLRIDLDDAATNRIELEGGGDLSLHCTKQADVLLTGRYTLSDGLVKYNMPVIANKMLKIRENSYLEWTGDVLDPYLSLKATERIRTAVHTDGQAPHSVNFEAGIEVKRRLSDLSLQFTLDAPEDPALQNRLVAMGPEERSKQAVGLLLSGMYLAGDDAGIRKLDVGMALNSFLRSEINSITGSLLKNVDLDFSMDSYDGMDGSGRRTDYAFRFSRRFYGERLGVILGGRLSTGDVPEENSMFINDASLEYRLDVSGSRYAKVFYNRRYESLLEGEISKYGAGIVFRRKMQRLQELFQFRRQQLLPRIEPESPTDIPKP